MLLDPQRRKLFIFAGQRHDAYMSDLWAYGLDDGELRLESADYTQAGGPEGGFTQRTTIDEHGEWLMISGLQKDQRQQSSMVKNSMWIRRATGEWIRLDSAKNAPQRSDRGEVELPRPRYAHQVRWLLQVALKPADGLQPLDARALPVREMRMSAV